MNLMKRVLVVDDDPVVGQSFERVLAPKGYAVIHAADGREALDRLVREDYDLVYTDIKMPGVSGIEVARRIRASHPWMPVVIITGYGTADTAAEARKLGVAAYVEKPLTAEAIEGMTAEFTVEAPMAALDLFPPKLPSLPAERAAGAPRPGNAWIFVRNTGLFLAAPLIGLAYILIGPLVGLGMLAWFGGKTLVEKAKGGRS